MMEFEDLKVGTYWCSEEYSGLAPVKVVANTMQGAADLYYRLASPDANKAMRVRVVSTIPASTQVYIMGTYPICYWHLAEDRSLDTSCGRIESMPHKDLQNCPGCGSKIKIVTS